MNVAGGDSGNLQTRFTARINFGPEAKMTTSRKTPKLSVSTSNCPQTHVGRTVQLKLDFCIIKKSAVEENVFI